ncbi:hypothetical protein ANANG_G00075580 [Anguilla anguilla]|uniref:Nicotinate phosphoribosyltransferase C-terminal domain-containing protein n=1 Tax=Anguilla anguilla TaxID=7936 RepID=A0A9D3MNX2_ANGAN|nr:hypothetical protein ANANG_G00075580 [Anguilla anguilla]
MKLSEDPEKSTMPGRRACTGSWTPRATPSWTCCACRRNRPLRRAWLSGATLSGGPGRRHGDGLPGDQTAAGSLLRDRNAKEVRESVQSSLKTLQPQHKRLKDPEIYTVAASEKLHAVLKEVRRGDRKQNSSSGKILVEN